ncbi:MAG: preprotein translocase subunit SecY [Deltaproteobacteria bacterium CG11_big_fil_rev_8_21_14_0_20_47_16]|nr:MAG: preprotein translocase subunit SecY [Deltaproteobacteria bacterium CG11_big_fil_rev_8_21_14_0_20_47_16]
MATVGNLAKIPELRRRILFTVAMLGLYRIGIYVPTPGVNTSALAKLLKPGTVFDIFNLFSGGALERFSVFALGIMPYISASIIFQLLAVAVPAIAEMQKEGDSGRKKITQYTRYSTVVLSLVQSFGISYGLVQQGIMLPGMSIVAFCVSTMVTLTAGTCFLMWLGEQITERGIGNGISLIIFAGIVTRIPPGIVAAWSNRSQYGLFGFLLILAFIAAIITFIVYFERAQRRIPVQYAKRVVGRKMYGGQATHLPLKLNMSGVIPPIFASSLIMFPATIVQFMPNETLKAFAQELGQGWMHDTLYVALIVFFTFFYTAVTFNPVDVADNLRKYGGYVPGLRPGKATSDYIDRVLTRITVGGAAYLSFVCLLPSILSNQFQIPGLLAVTFGGTSLLIVVGVAMDTIAQIETHLLSRNYDGFMSGSSGGRFKGRAG